MSIELEQYLKITFHVKSECGMSESSKLEIWQLFYLYGNPTTYCQGILRFLQILEFWIKVGCLFEILFTFRQIWRRRDLVKNFTQAPRTNCRSSSTTIGLNSYRWCPTTCSLKVLLVKTLEILTAVSAKREKEKWFDLVPDPLQLYRLGQLII